MTDERPVSCAQCTKHIGHELTGPPWFVLDREVVQIEGWQFDTTPIDFCSPRCAAAFLIDYATELEAAKAVKEEWMEQ